MINDKKHETVKYERLKDCGTEITGVQNSGKYKQHHDLTDELFTMYNTLLGTFETIDIYGEKLKGLKETIRAGKGQANK